jgi:hypothetical protein
VDANMEMETREQLIRTVKVMLGVDNPDWPSPAYLTRSDLIKLVTWMKIKDKVINEQAK